MARNVVRSARGEIVDFDLLKIKQQMAELPKSIVVEARESFIDNKFKRQLKRQTQEAVALVTADNEIETVEDIMDEPELIDEPIITENQTKNKGK